MMRVAKAFATFAVALAALISGWAGGAVGAERDGAEAAWDKAQVMISGSLVGSDEPFVWGHMDGGTIPKHFEKLDGQRDVPVVVAVSGSNFDMASLQRFAEPMMDLGLVVVILESRVRMACGRPCDEERARSSLELRVAEAAYAHERLMAFSWASQSKSVLLGVNWGALATAIYPGDDYGARMILGWTCHTRDWDWLDGVRGSPQTPVFSVISAHDPISGWKAWAPGHCRVEGRPHSEALVLDTYAHSVVELLEVRQAAHRFLWANIDGGALAGSEGVRDHRLAPQVVEKSAERIRMKPGGSTGEVYAWAKTHCGSFGKTSHLVNTTTDGDSYLFLCE